MPGRRSKLRPPSTLHAGKPFEAEIPFGAACREGARNRGPLRICMLGRSVEGVGLRKLRAGRCPREGRAWRTTSWEGKGKGWSLRRRMLGRRGTGVSGREGRGWEGDPKGGPLRPCMLGRKFDMCPERNSPHGQQVAKATPFERACWDAARRRRARCAASRDAKREPWGCTGCMLGCSAKGGRLAALHAEMQWREGGGARAARAERVRLEARRPGKMTQLETWNSARWRGRGRARRDP